MSVVLVPVVSHRSFHLREGEEYCCFIILTIRTIRVIMERVSYEG